MKILNDKTEEPIFFQNMAVGGDPARNAGLLSR